MYNHAKTNILQHTEAYIFRYITIGWNAQFFIVTYGGLFEEI